MSSKPSLLELLNHPCYLTLNKFIEASKFKIARSSVRDAIKKIKGEFDLAKLHEVLTSFFSDLMVIQIDSYVDNLEHILTPCFLIRAQENQFTIYVVLKIEDEKVTIFEDEKKEHAITTNEFQELLKGCILILKEEETYSPTENILKAYNIEQEEDKAYKESIKVIDNFLSQKDCEKIISYCEESSLFKRSKIGGSYGVKVSDYRTSSSAVIEMNEDTSIIPNLREKIASFLGCPIHKIEKLQTVRYYKTETYKAHFDSHKNNRQLTCLLYLNEGFMGGETYFPEIDFGVSPKVGRLLVFNNLQNGEVISQSLHQGSAVLEGLKYACNIWIRS